MLGSLIYNTLSTSPSLVRQTCASQATQKGWFHVKCVGGRPGIWGSHFRVPGPTLSSWDFSSCRQPHAAFCRLSGLAGPAGTARGSPLCEESNVNQGDSLGSSTLLCSPGSCSNHHCSLCPLQCLQTAVIWGATHPPTLGRLASWLPITTQGQLRSGATGFCSLWVLCYGAGKGPGKVLGIPMSRCLKQAL